MPATSDQTGGFQTTASVRAALHVIHWMITSARREALDWTHGRKPVNPQRMVDLLDAVEVFPDLIKHDHSDSMDSFRSMLAAVSQDYPEFSGLLREFDRRVELAELPSSNTGKAANSKLLTTT